MSRAVLLPISAMVLLASAVAVLASAILLPMPDNGGRTVGAGPAVGRRFYAAVNTVIATGDPHALREVVAPGFVDETPLPGLSSGRDGLEAYLLFLHITAPTTRLTGTILLATPDRVVAQVAAQGQSPSRAAGALAAHSAAWGAIDVLRIVDGMIAGRWSATEHMTLQRPLATASLTLSAPIPRLLTLSRVTLAPGARWDAATDGPSLLVWEAGSLVVSIATDVGQVSMRNGRTEAPLPAVLAAARPVVAPAGTLFTMRNGGNGPAQALVVGFAVPRPPNGAQPTASQLPSGVQRHVLAGDLATGLSSKHVTLTVERVALAREADWTVSSASGPVLLSVEAGQLTAATSGTMWVRTGHDGMNTATAAALLTPGDGLLQRPGALMVLEPSGPAPIEAIIVTIHQNEPA